MMERRYYVVKDSQANVERLVDAGSQSQAIRHCVKGRFTAKPADPREVARLMKAGVEVETCDGKGDAA